jgi:DDE family transposase/transposase-like protein DUF772
MIRIKNHKQQELFDPWAFLSPKRRKLLDQSWAGLFQKQILSELPVPEIIHLFCDDFGRPSKELYTILGTVLLQQMFDLTDDETVDQLAFNIQWHYALNITEESDSAKYMCLKTLWTMRHAIAENGFESNIFDCTTNKLAKIFEVNTDQQRIDSVHIKSNMRRLGRIRIFSTSIHKFLINLKRGHNQFFVMVDQKLVDKYDSDKALSCFAMVKPSESHKTLIGVATDLFDLMQQFKDCPDVTVMHSYKLLERILNEQCCLNPSDTENPVAIKPPKEIPADSLQNPSDPDATYSGHKGQGYQVQVMETFVETQTKEEKIQSLNLITHVEVEKACQSDAQALMPAIESTQVRNLGPKELQADSLYGSDDNYASAKQSGVELVAPTMGLKEKKPVNLSQFTFSSKGHVTSCPQGNQPLVTKKKKNRFAQGFNIENCQQCPLVKDCPVKAGKKFYYIRYTAKEVRLAQRRAFEKTEEFKDRYRWRAGVEATMSELDRRTGIKHLRVRGFKAVRFCAVLKAAGLNILRAAAVRKAANSHSAYNRVYSTCNRAIIVVKEQFNWIGNYLKDIFFRFGFYNELMVSLA